MLINNTFFKKEYNYKKKVLFITMSHFTYLETQFQNLFYLEKTLNQLNIIYQKKSVDKNLATNLIIPQSNGSNSTFSWNGQKYELVSDIDLWKQANSIKTFIHQVSKQYASEVLVGEGQKTGFQPVKYQQNSDGSDKLILERWNFVKPKKEVLW